MTTATPSVVLETDLHTGPRLARRLTRAVLALLCVVTAAPTAAQDRDRWKTDFTKATVDASEIVSGGVPRDGIPAIDRPRFERVEEADEWIGDRAAVAVLTLHGITKLYPLQILVQHEIVNDEIGTVAVAVTYCPLCNTTVAFRRELGGTVLDFATTGRLRFSDLIMYDRQTETWWQQATGEGIVGEHAGKILPLLATQVIAWREAKRDYPDSRVLSRRTGFDRQYGRSPYVGYDSRSRPFADIFRGDRDDRLPMMERVIAINTADGPLAIPFSELPERPAFPFEIAGTAVVAFWTSGQASALDAIWMDGGRDVGSTGVFVATVDGRSATFEPEPDGLFRDDVTGSLWTVTGRAVSGEMEGTQLTPIMHWNHFWFAWFAFQPETRILR